MSRPIRRPPPPLGTVQTGDAIRRLARPHAGWPLARLMQLIDSRDCDPATLALPLPASWGRLFRARLTSGQAEAWQRRMDGGA